MKLTISQGSTLPDFRVSRKNLSFQRGLSLIELMISITLGLIILAALSTLFINQTRTRVELDKSNRMIDNGRYAMELLADDLRLSGYFGELVPPVSTCSYVPVGIQGEDANLSSTPAIPDGVVGITAADLLAGSDIFVVRRASTGTPTAASSAVDGVKYLQVSLCQFDTKKYVISSTPADFTLRKKDCQFDDVIPTDNLSPGLADLRRILEHVYFISPNNEPGDGIPTLKRQETNLSTGVRQIVPLVEGIAFMQIEYGIDNNGSNILYADTTNGSMVLTELSADPASSRVKLGMGVHSNVPTGNVANPLFLPAGSVVQGMTATLNGTKGTITLDKAATKDYTQLPLVIPYLTATITPGSNVLTNVSADPNLALVRAGYEICGGTIDFGSTIDAITANTITLSKPALACDPSNPLALCPLVPLTIPEIIISPKTLAGDGVADTYTSAPTSADWANVVSVKLTLLARNVETTKGHVDTKTYEMGRDSAGAMQTAGPFNSEYKGHVYTQFIRLVNVAGRRE